LWSSWRTWRGHRVVVTMIDPANTATSTVLSGAGVLYHTGTRPRDVQVITPTTGQYLPATFTATLPTCTVTFTLDVVRKVRGPVDADGVRFTFLQVEGSQGFDHDDVPLGLLRSLAVRASTFTLWLVPPNTTYTAYGVEWRSDDDGAFQIVGPGTTPPAVLHDLTRQADLLEQVAQVWRNTPHGEKYQEIAATFGFGTDWAHKQVKRARKAHPHLFERDGGPRKGSGKAAAPKRPQARKTGKKPQAAKRPKGGSK